MNNAEKFNQLFGIYATELWAKSEAELLDWLRGEYGAVEAGGESGVVFNYRTPKRGGEYMVYVRDDSGDGAYEYVTSAVWLMIDANTGGWVKDDEWLYGVVGWCEYPKTREIHFRECK